RYMERLRRRHGHRKSSRELQAVRTAGRMPHQFSSAQKHIDALSRLVFLCYSKDFNVPNENLEPVFPDFEYAAGLDVAERAEFLRLADMHHVTVRGLEILEKSASTLGSESLRVWCQNVLSRERSRIDFAIRSLFPICEALEAAGAKVAVIKSLDHWPDLGSDLDLYTSGNQSTVIRAMSEAFQANLEPRSWGDRLANKWNFRVPGLSELVEIHIGYLGQTGEHQAMARRVIERRVTKTVNGYTFQIPAPEERVVISTLQRMYRHFYFRLCDMVDFALLLQSGAIDFAELRNAALIGGIWPGVATFLLLVSEYAKAFGGSAPIPGDVLKSAHSQDIRVYLGGNFLRVPKGPAAALYASQLMNAGRRVDFRAMSRLPLLPPLAISAFLAYKLTGSDKGVW
ncbi:MAG: hypothetical protein ACRD2S_06080, partial [Terriglobales bacterium]